MSTNITLALLMVCSIYFAGRIALPLVFLFPNLHGKDGDRA